MTATAADLLPGNAGAFEKAAAAAITDVLPVPLRQIVDPAVTPAAFLPFLAAHESVDLWFEDWSEERKRAMVAEAVELAALKGTRLGAERFLSYVDAELIDVIAYPARFVMNHAIIGRTPLNHPPFLARYLVKVVTTLAPRSLVIGRGAIGRNAMRRPSRDKFDRALIALRTAKAPETEIRVNFTHKRQIRLSDAPRLDGAGQYRLGQYIDRRKL